MPRPTSLETTIHSAADVPPGGQQFVHFCHQRGRCLGFARGFGQGDQHVVGQQRQAVHQDDAGRRSVRQRVRPYGGLTRVARRLDRVPVGRPLRLVCLDAPTHLVVPRLGGGHVQDIPPALRWAAANASA